jgi:hypothetical protein
MKLEGKSLLGRTGAHGEIMLIDITVIGVNVLVCGLDLSV